MKPSRKATRNQKVAASPGVLTLGPLTLLVIAPTGADTMALRKWARARWKERLKSLPVPVGITTAELEGLSPEDRMTVLKSYGQHKAANPERQITADEAFDILTTPDGMALMIYLSARHHTPDVTYEAVRAQITDENVDAVQEAFNEQTAPEDPETGDPDPNERGRDTSSPSTSRSPTASPTIPGNPPPESPSPSSASPSMSPTRISSHVN